MEACFHATFGEVDGTRAWWVPGRIEVLGKHTDYGGGRSLLCAVERGFHVLATPRSDHLVRVVDSTTGAHAELVLDPGLRHQPGQWIDYPISVVRRIARDFPGIRTGMNLVLQSTLPPASGLSSSSALVIATFLPLASFNHLDAREDWRRAIPTDDACAEYLGAIENGRAFADFPADHGVGTQGGSEDHTAILRSAPGRLVQYHFIPATREAEVDLPRGWTFVIGASGVHAPKGGRVRERYNALSDELATLLAIWNAHSAPPARSLFAALRTRPGADALLSEWTTGRPDGAALRERLGQFQNETGTIIPGVVQHLARGDASGIGPLVAASEALAEECLRNQVPETIGLVRSALALGAAAASAFGAGFGGSVWALVRNEDAESFRKRWAATYAAEYPMHQHRHSFFESGAGPAAHELCR